MRATAVMLFTFLPLALQAQALPLTVGEMNRACGIITAQDGEVTPENAVAVGACFGAMRGVVQVMQANCRSFTAGRRPARGLSVGEIPSPEAAIDAFRAWVQANPQEAEAPAEYGIIVALGQAFPCRFAPGGAAPQEGEDSTALDPAQTSDGEEPTPGR